MSEEVFSELGIFSQTLTPDQVNSILGIKCDKSYLIGDLREHTIIREKKNGWIVRSRLPRSFALEEHVADVLTRVSPAIDKIRHMAEQADVAVQFGCVIYTRQRPALNFSKEVVATICSLGASIDIDLYLLPEEDED